MNHLSILLFDRLQVFLNEDEVTNFRMHKVRALLAYLAAAPTQAHRRETLMTLLWPGMPEQSARSNLRQVLFHLRQAVPDFEEENAQGHKQILPLLITNRQTMQLNPQAQIKIDAYEFDNLLDQTLVHNHVDFFTCHICRQMLANAVDIYKGNFLADFYLEDSNEFEEWAEITRQSYKRKALDALETLATIFTRQKAYTAARSYAERQIELDDLRESGYRQLMEILALNGQRAEALSYYENFRRLLADELGMSPSTRTTALYEKIQAGDLQFDFLPEQAVRGYELGEEIGAGAYGTIHRAVQPAIGREVAVKIIRRRYANDPAFIRRFEAEAQTIARLEHPHIVPLYDYWREPAGAYLVMRLLRGGNLLSALEEGPWPPERAAKLLDQIAPALNTAHRQGIVHRDIKPANILFDEAGNGYISDFGIAKDLSADPHAGENQLTLQGEILGTPDYISPEQLQEKAVSPQSDIYSLGAVLYEILTGEKPFPNAPLITIIQNHLNTPFPLAGSSVPGLPAEIDLVIQRATAKNPADRYGDVLQMADAFRQALHGRLPDPQHFSAIKRLDDADIINPYKGLRSFQEADALNFFGREALISQLLKQLDAGRFLAVVGPSGSGKSSAVKAGLIPALREGSLPGSENWYIAEMVPGTHPLEELELALWPLAVDPPSSLVEPMSRDSRGMLRTIRRILPAEEDVQLLLIIDQFEELFTMVDDESRRNHFLDSLLETINAPRSPVRVLVTMRADFYDRPLQHQPLAELFKKHTELVLPLNQDELTWAIQEPARRNGVGFGDGLVATIVSDVVGQPGALPLMQYALTELFDARRDQTLSPPDYKDIGGVLGALARRAGQIYDQLSLAEKASTRQLFLRLVTLGEGIEDTRRRVRLSELDALLLDQAAGADQTPLNTAINQFGAARLLTFDHDPLTREPTVEVAHEALLREWSRLRRWLEESRGDIRLQRALAAAAAEWQAAGHDPGYLLHGPRLSQFEGWAEETTISLTQAEQAYLQAGLEQRRQRQAAEETRRQMELETVQQLAQSQAQRAAEQEQASSSLRRRAYFLVGALAIALILAIVALFAGYQAANNAAVAERSAAESNSLALASGAQAALANSNDDFALTLALAANQIPDPPAFAQQMLYEAALSPGTIQLIDGGGEFRWDMDVHPNGQIVASGADNGTISLFNVNTGVEEMLLAGGHTEVIGGVAFTPDGSMLLSGGFDDKLVLWDLQTGQIIREMQNPRGDVNSTAISPDGTLAVAGTEGGVVTLWNLQTGGLLGELAGHDPELQIQGTAFSPDGKLAASASEDHTVIIWDVAAQSMLHQLKGHENIVFDVAFSPDGQTLASAGFDGRVILWDVASGAQIAALEGHKDYVFDVAFNKDGTKLLSSSRDQSVILWDVASGQPIEIYQGEAGRIFSVDFLDEERAISTASTGNLRVWALHDQKIKQRFQLTADFMSSFAQSVDGRTAAVGLVEEIQLVDLQTGAILQQLPFPAQGVNALLIGEVTSLAFDEKGERLLSGSDEGAIILWDLNDGQEIGRFDTHLLEGANQHSARILDLLFSPDGTQFISTSDDKSMILWDIASGAILHRYSSPSDTINAVAYAPDGQTIAGGSGTYRYIVEGDFNDNNIHIWDADSLQEIRQISGHEGPVTALRFSADGKSLLTGSVDETVRLWDVQTGQQKRRFDGHTGGVFDVNFSPDGQHAVSGAVDGTVILWDIENGDLLRQLSGHEGLVYHARFAGDHGGEDGQAVWSAAEDGQAILWNLALDRDELLTWAQANRYVPEFSCNQRAQYQIEPLCAEE